MSRRVEIAAALALAGSTLAGCTKDGPPAPELDAAPARPLTTNVPRMAIAVAEAGADAASPLGGLVDCEEGTPRTGKSIGHTSVVFKVELSNGKKAAWKPNAKKVKGRYKGEVAAYRLGTALGIANVPPVCFRAFDAASASAALAGSEPARKLFGDEVIVDGGTVKGAVIPWIDGLQFWPLEKDPLRSDMKRWLTAKSEIPADKADFARQASTLVVFDFLTSNWDRYSGENVGLDKAGAVVLYIDNDGAFMEGPPKEGLTRNRERVVATDRFSRSVVAHLRALAPTGALEQVFGEETKGTPLLAAPIVAGVAQRLKDLLGLIDEKKKAHGESETLFFP